MLNPSICYSLTRYNDEWSQNHMQYVKLMCQLALTFLGLTIFPPPFCFATGVVLGFSYAQTRNLLTPITIHAVWNSGVILLLTFLQVDLNFSFFFNSISSFFFQEWQNELALILLGTVGAKHLIPIIYWQLTFTTELNYFKCVSLSISDY